MTKLLPLLAIMALLGLVSVAHAQSMDPTVSTIAITSAPGTDNTYATGDTITVGVTFSEAVTVTTTSGTPRITLDIGEQPRYASYTGAGSVTGQILFQYTVLVSDTDADGVSVVANSLALDGGTIRATGDSTDATLTHTAMSFSDHKVDTNVRLLSNTRVGNTTPHTISATQSAEFEIQLAPYKGFTVNEIALNVTAPSDTLQVTVKVEDHLDNILTYSGSVTSTGWQTFTYADNLPKWPTIRAVQSARQFFITIEGSGAGSIQVEAAANQGRDQGSASGLTFFNNVNIFEQYAKIQLKGYEGAIPEIVHSGIFTTPENGTAYAVGERVVIQVVFSHPVTHPESPSLPFWLGDGSQHRREAPLFHTRTFGFHYLAFAYTVTSGDMDIDGIYISADPLGDNAGGDFHFEGQATVPADTKLAANQLPAGYSVDGSRSPTCAEVFCSNLKVGQRRGSLGFSFHPGANIPYEQFGVASALIFEYDSTVHFLSFLNITPSFQVLQVNFASALAPALIQRGAFDIGDRRFLLREADDSFQNENNAYFSWDNHGLTWAEEDVVAIKVIETATATFDAATYDKTEGDTFDVTVTLDEAFTHTQTIPIKVEANGGATEDDYSGIPEDLTFAPGDTEKTFTVTVTDDTVDDDDESITLSFDDNHIRPGGTNETGTITLTDNDDPQVEVEFGAGSYTVAEGGTQSFTVELSADPERTLIIPIDATGLGGATTADYSGVPETVTFTPANWDTPKSFTFAATQDGEDDDEDQVKLTFGTMPDDRVDPGATDELTFSITDDDDPFVTVEFGASAYTVAESDVAATLNVTENEVEVTVTLSADPERTVIIPIERTDLGGVSSADYSTLPTSVTFNAGDTSKSFTFTATHDTVDDDDESVKLTFGTMPDGRVSEGATDVTTVTITDDDHPEVTVEFGQDEQRVGEGETINVTVKLSADPEREVMIPVTSTVQGMASAADYSVPTSVTFNNGEIEKTIVFMAVDDMVDDDDESVKLGFGTSLPVRVTAGTRTETTININDDDDPEVTVQFGASTYTVAESDNATTPNVTENRVVVTVTLDKDPERTIIMPITPTMVGTASAADYSGVPPSVTFNSGDTSMTFTFSATEDVIDDDGEGVKLTFGTMPDPRVSAGTTNETTVSITDDDTADIVISPVSLSVDEENDSSYSVRLDTEPTVNVTVTISGHSGTDLTLEGVKLSNDALTFTPANWGTPQTVTVEAAHDDDGVADNETLTHTASGAEYAGLTKALPVTVNDNDPLGISISPLALTVDEGESADYAVSLDTEPTVAVTVTISGHTGTDLTLSGSTLASDALTFTAADWDTPQTITVSAGHDDDIGDDSETLTHTGGGGEYEGLAEGLPVLIDDNTGNLRLVGGTLTDEDGNLCEGRLEIYYNGEWGTICDDYWTGNDADVACRALGFVGGSVEDWGRFRTAVKAGFPAGAADQQIMLDDLRCGGKEWNLLECTASQVGKNNCRQREDVGLRCIKNSAGAHVISLEISPAPGGNGKYDAGETVTVTVVWSEPVNVTVPPPSSSDDDIDPPHLHLAYGWPGAPTTEAVYSSGSGTARTAFTATVEDRGNAPYSRVDVYQESLSFGEGTITSVMTGNPVILGQGFHRGPETGEQAEAVTITGVPTFNDPGEDGVFGAGEMVKVTFIFSQPVQVDTAGGTPSVEVLLSGTSGKQALYLSGSGAGQLVFGYTLAEADGEHSSLLVDPNSLALNGGAIRDVANNLDADIGHQGGGATFARPVEATAPQLQSATVDGSTLTLTFDETLDVGATPSSTAFTVNVNGVEHNILIVGLGGANVLLTLSTAVESGDTVTVDYAKPSGANVIKDTDGNEADSFTGQAVTNNTAAPVTSKSDPVQAPDSLNVARHESGKLSASWDAPASGPTPTGYTVQWKESGDDWAVKADVSEANVKGASHVITGLTDGTEYAVRVMARKGDDDSAPSGEITGTPRETAAPTVSSAAVDGTTLTITFSEGLTDSPAPATTTFTVTVGGNDRGVDVVTVSGSTVTLTLATAVSSGDQVTVDYTVPTDQAAARLKDLNDNPAESFSGQQVTNNTVASLPAGSLLTVAHFADNGLETVVLASFDSGGDTTFYSAADSRWGESGKLVEGDVDLNENTRIVRVMAPNSDGSLLRLNDNGGLTLRDFFGPSGTGADLTVWVQTSEGTASFAASPVRTAGGDYVNFNVPSGDRSVLTGIGSDDRFLLALTRPAPNTPAAGDPTITGTAQVGQTLTAGTNAISDAEGLDNVAYTYQWLANDTEITDAAAYTLVDDDEGKKIKVKVSFSDDEGNAEERTSAETATVAAAPNTPATGDPTITGMAQVGQTLTADTSALADAEGLTNVAYAYQWLADDTGITDATTSSYTLTETEESKAIKVRVSFTDDASNPETLTSAATAAVAAAIPGAPDGLTVSVNDTGKLDLSWDAPGSDGGSAITGYKVQWKETADSWDTAADVSEATATGTTYTVSGLTDGTEYTFRVTAVNSVGDSDASGEATGTPRETTAPTVSSAAVDGATLTITFSEALAETPVPATATFSVTVGEAARGVDSVSISGSVVTLTLNTAVAYGDTVTVGYGVPTDLAAARLKDLNENPAESFSSQQVTNNEEVENSDATGSPTIIGTAQVGETLTVSIAGIADGDGLTNVSYTYQWIANDEISDSDIQDATAGTYTVVPDDVGKTIKVKVSFTDDANNAETLTSPATAAVAAAVAEAPGDLTVSVNGTGKLYLSWDAPGSNGGSAVTGYKVQWKESADSWGTPADVSETTATGTSQTVSGLTDGTEYSFRVLAVNSAGDSDASGEATGTPRETVPPTPSSAIVDGATLTITFSEALGESPVPAITTFTVSVAGSSHGVETVSVLGSVVTLTLETAVAAGDAVTVDYTVPTDQAAVRLTDLNDNPAESFSGQAVTNKTNRLATGKPGVTGTAQVDELLTATTSGIRDADGLENVAFQYRWLADDAEIADATGSTYTPASGDVGKAIKVKVTFTDDAGHAESLTSEAVGPVVAAPSPQPPVATITPGTTPVEEGEAASFTISLDRPAPAALSVSFSVSDPGGVLSGAAPESVAFASGDSSKTVSLGTLDDDVIEPGSTVTASLAAGTGYTLGGTTSASVRTTDNDVATWTVSVEPSEIEEGASSTFTVAVANGKTFAAEQTIGLAVTGTASGSDYTLSTTELTLDEGTTAVAATVTATDDATTEGDETVIVAATHDGQAIGSATVTILANDTPPPSSDATLSSLALSGVDIGVFSSESTAYSASVDYGVSSTEVTADPTDDGASVTIADADGSTLGTSRTVSLSTGDNEITVTVTAEDEATTKVYTITVARAGPEVDWGERLPDRDIVLGSGALPSGMWSDGDAMWVITNPGTGRIRVYSLADGAEQTARGFTLSGGVDSASALWSDGSTLWVADLNAGAVRAHGLSDGARQADDDLDPAVLAGAGNYLPSGLWSDGATMWVADYGAMRVFAYDLTSKARQESKEFDLNKQPGQSYNPYGIWSNGDTMLVADWIGGGILAHDLSDGQRKRDLDVSTLASGTYFPTGIWTDGDTLWVSDDFAGTLYAYAVPGLGSTP